MQQKRNGWQGIRAIEAFEYEVQEVTSNIVRKMKNCHTTGIPGTKGHFQIKLPLILMVFLMYQ